jgi:hypothetical protein
MDQTARIRSRHPSRARHHSVEDSRRHSVQCPGRQLAAVGYLTRGPVRNHLVRVEDLTLVAFYRPGPANRFHVGRLVACRGVRTRRGVSWSTDQRNASTTDVDLLRRRTRDCRRSRDPVSALGQRLQRLLARYERFPQMPLRTTPQLPCLWAGFWPSVARRLQGGGPEFEAVCQQTATSPEQILHDSQRRHRHLVLYPLDWVSHHWRRAVSIFADLERFPQRQVIAMGGSTDGLQEYCGASHFDFSRGFYSMARHRVHGESTRAFPADANPRACSPQRGNSMPSSTKTRAIRRKPSTCGLHRANRRTDLGR